MATMYTSRTCTQAIAGCTPVMAAIQQTVSAQMAQPLPSRQRISRAFNLEGRLRASKPRFVVVKANYGGDWSTPQDAYLTIGLAHCFEKTDEGKVVDRFVIEPISANSMECMANGGKTCFTQVFSTTLGEVLGRNRSVIPEEFGDAIFCEEFDTRAEACARTWMRPHAIDNLLDLVPLGQVKSGYNFDLTDKRVLNMENVVNDDDNIKQDISIDVYGRKEKEQLQNEGEEEAAPAGAGAEEDELDSLLAG